LGLSEEEFNEARARHEAGELTLAEAEALQALAEQEMVHNGHDDGDYPARRNMDDELDDPEHARLSSSEWRPRTGPADF
jgi:hypothetical protein